MSGGTHPGAAELLALSDSIAREAGGQLLEYFRAGHRGVATKSTPTDLVSEADLATEKLIRDRLAADRPDDAIVGEEGDDTPGTSGLRWVVDPLDGTVNFLFGIPQWCVSVAVQDETGTVAGVVYDPNRDQLWAATRESGATCDGEPIHGSERDELATSMIATGFGYDRDVRATQVALVARLLPEVRDIRRMGSAALDLAWTAAGRYDAYFERGTKEWDIAAGALICERAGLQTRRLEPVPPSEWGIVAAPPGLMERLAPLLD